MPDMLDVNRLRQITDSMIAVLTSPPFVEAMRTMKTTPENQRLKVGAQILTSEALRARGVPIPPDMRITSRYFETGQQTVEIADSPQVGDQAVAKFIDEPTISRMLAANRLPLADGGCCCGGAGTVCGGCGG